MESKKDSKRNSDKYFASDETFNRLLPGHIRDVAARHWTPLEVAIKSAKFLCTHAGAKILDIGSGAGKFCLIAAYHHPDMHFTGIEQREDLVELSRELQERLLLQNVSFIHGNIKEFDTSSFDHFYFYNSFYENLPGTQKIDYDISYSEKLYDYYNLLLYKKLNRTPSGTRLVTYHSLGNEVPPGFEVLHTEFADFLRFWQKI